MSTWIPPVPDDATIIYDPEAGIGSLADIKAGDIVTAQADVSLVTKPPFAAECYLNNVDQLCAGGWSVRSLDVLRAFRLAPVSVPLPTEGGPHAIRATVRGVEGKVPLFGPDAHGTWLSLDDFGGYCYHDPADIVWDGQAYVGPGEQSSEADR